LDEEGEVFVFLQPFPQEAEKLRFILIDATAVQQDGTEVPLSLRFTEFSAPNLTRQRLVASGILPPGKYRGLSFHAEKAMLLTDEGEASLLTSDQRVAAEFPFMVVPKKALTLHLNFLYQKSISGGYRFSPVFSVARPHQPVASLLGYVSNSGDNTITVFDKKSGQVMYLIATGREPRGVVFDRARNLAYAAIAGEDAVSVIDMTAGEPLRTIRLHTGSSPRDLALTPDGKLLLSVNPGTRTVSFIDPLSFLELGSTLVGHDPAAILLDRAGGNRAYVFNTTSNSISVIDVAARKTSATVATETGPLRGAFNKKGDRLYVINEMTPHLTVIDPASLQVVDQVFIQRPAGSVTVDTMTGTVYFSGTQSGSVDMYEPFSLFATEFCSADGGVSYLTVDDQENSLFLLSPALKTVTNVNINTRNIVYTIDVGESSYQVTIMGER
jgi:YVTN family beta-propeller protein